MNPYKRTTVAGAAIATLLAAAAPVLAAAGPASASAHAAARVDGVWRADGYGTIVQITNGVMKTYDMTAISCLPDSLDSNDGSASTVTLGPGPDRATWRIDANVNSRALTRLPSLPAACTKATPDTPTEVFDIFWRTFAENYPFFGRHGVDWDQAYAKYRPMVTDSTTPTQLTAVLSDMIEPLHDAHVGLVVGSTPHVYIRPGASAPSPDFDAQALSLVEKADLGAASANLRTWCEGKVAYAELPGRIGYLRVSAFTGFTEADTFAANKAAFDAALNEVFTAHAVGSDGLRGLIVDVRVNSGGDDPLGLDLAGRLTAHPFPAYAKRVRNDPLDPDGFTAPRPIVVQPATTPRYTGPVAVLTSGSTFSAGETFTQALLNRTPRPVVVGENTQGVFSDILDRELPNGWWFGLPDEEYLTPRGTTYDVTGVPPDVRVPTLTAQQFADGTDPAFQEALAALASLRRN